MTLIPSRRSMIAGAAASAAALAAPGLIRPALAQGLAPTSTMRGGANNYRPGAPIRGARIQIWAHTTEGYERDPQSHGATLTDASGAFRMDMPQIVPAFGQPHGHLAYDAEFDGGSFETVFLRPVMPSARDASLEAHFVLAPA